jgi:hypothetical protein
MSGSNCFSFTLKWKEKDGGSSSTEEQETDMTPEAFSSNIRLQLSYSNSSRNSASTHLFGLVHLCKKNHPLRMNMREDGFWFVHNGSRSRSLKP